MKNMKTFKQFVSESVNILIKTKQNSIDKTLNKFKKYKIGDIIKVNLFDTDRYINSEIVISPYWNDNEDWMQVVINYNNETWSAYWSIKDKEWKLKDKI